MADTEQKEYRTLKPQEEFSGGYLLFDKKALHIKEWIAFRQDTIYVSLQNRIRLIDKQQGLIPQNSRLREQEALDQIRIIAAELDATRSRAREAGAALRDLTPRAILYRVTHVIAPVLAERIIPYKTSQSIVEEIRDQRKSAESQRREIKRDSEAEQVSLGRERYSLTTQLQEITQGWLFSTPERTLTHALIYFHQDTGVRNEFLLQYSQNTGTDYKDISAMYDELATKAAPSLRMGPTTRIISEASTEVGAHSTFTSLEDETPFDYKSYYEAFGHRIPDSVQSSLPVSNGPIEKEPIQKLPLGWLFRKPDDDRGKGIRYGVNLLTEDEVSEFILKRAGKIAKGNQNTLDDCRDIVNAVRDFPFIAEGSGVEKLRLRMVIEETVCPLLSFRPHLRAGFKLRNKDYEYVLRFVYAIYETGGQKIIIPDGDGLFIHKEYDKRYGSYATYRR